VKVSCHNSVNGEQTFGKQRREIADGIVNQFNSAGSRRGAKWKLCGGPNLWRNLLLSRTTKS
jgi:hypothetical protein